MSNPKYDLQTVTQYLLGELPEAEAERLDELSIADGEFVDTLRSAENDLVDAYAQEELSSASRAQFESHYLASPRRRERANLARALQEFGAKAIAARAADFPQKDEREVPARRGRSGWVPAFAGPLLRRPGLQWGVTLAALVLLIAGGVLLFQNLRLRQQMTQTAARRDELGRHEQELQKEIQEQRTANSKTEQDLAQLRAERERLDQELNQQKNSQPTNQSPGSVASLVLTPQMRGAANTQTLSITAATRTVTARLSLEPNDFDTYRVALLDQASHQTLWRSGNLRAKGVQDRKSLSLSFPAGLLKPQTYTLQVSGVSSNGAAQTISDYPFRVVK